MTIPEEKLREILALTDKATPGPWKCKGAIVETPDGWWSQSSTKLPVKEVSPTAIYIAACSPDTVKAIVQELLAARAEIERLRELISGMEGCIGPCDSFGICPACTVRALVNHD